MNWDEEAKKGISLRLHGGDLTATEIIEYELKHSFLFFQAQNLLQQLEQKNLLLLVRETKQYELDNEFLDLLDQTYNDLSKNN